MCVFELVQPGSWLQGVDDQLRSDVESLLQLLVTSLDDAAVTLIMFEQSRAADHMSGGERLASWEAERERERAIESALERQLPSDLTYEARWQAMDRIREEARQEAKRQKWQEGGVPESYTHRIPFIHAKSCIYALDTLVKAMHQLAELPGMPVAVAETLRDLHEAFPDLVHVRNSSHHAEDRVQGKGLKGRIDLKPLTDGGVHTPGGGVLVVENLHNNRYGGTLGDGSYGEIEVSHQTVATAQRCVQRVLDSFEWHGPAVHLPR